MELIETGSVKDRGKRKASSAASNEPESDDGGGDTAAENEDGMVATRLCLSVMYIIKMSKEKVAQTHSQ